MNASGTPLLSVTQTRGGVWGALRHAVRAAGPSRAVASQSGRGGAVSLSHEYAESS